MSAEADVCDVFAGPLSPDPHCYVIQREDIFKWRLWMFGEWWITAQWFGRTIGHEDIGRRVWKRAGVIIPETDNERKNRTMSVTTSNAAPVLELATSSTATTGKTGKTGKTPAALPVPIAPGIGVGPDKALDLMEKYHQDFKAGWDSVDYEPGPHRAEATEDNLAWRYGRACAWVRGEIITLVQRGEKIAKDALP